MASRRPKWTVKTSEQLKTLHAEGNSLRKTAELLGQAPSTVSHHAKRLGLEWTRRAQVAKAVEAKREQNEKDREDRRLRDAVLLDWLEEHEFDLEAYLRDPQYFYKKGRGGEQVLVWVDDANPFPMEQRLEGLRTLHDLRLTKVRIETMSVTEVAGKELAKSMVETAVKAFGEVKRSPEELREAFQQNIKTVEEANEEIAQVMADANRR